MIVEWWVAKILDIVIALHEEVPEVTLEYGAIADGLAMAFTFDSILPMHETVDVMKFLVAWKFGILLLQAIRMVLSHMPFVGGSGP